LDLISRCIGSVYLPVDEDSYGYVCYEAAMSSKPSVTATDSGGTLTLVNHGRTGLVSEPEPRALAAAFDELSRNRDRARQMGENARAAALSLDLSWSRVVEELTR
ncbi:MAG TPA: glycosyltransferase, partial [Pengzhenrongella sp.]